MRRLSLALIALIGLTSAVLADRLWMNTYPFIGGASSPFLVDWARYRDLEVKVSGTDYSRAAAYRQVGSR